MCLFFHFRQMCEFVSQNDLIDFVVHEAGAIKTIDELFVFHIRIEVAGAQLKGMHVGFL